MHDKRYERPMIIDYGELTDLTEASALMGPEDGGSKLLELLPHHSLP